MTNRLPEHDDDLLEKSIERTRMQTQELSQRTGINVARLEQYIARRLGPDCTAEPKIARVLAQAVVAKVYAVASDAHELARLRSTALDDPRIAITDIPLVDFVVRDAARASASPPPECAPPVLDVAARLAARERVSEYPAAVLSALPRVGSGSSAISARDVLGALSRDRYYARNPAKLRSITAAAKTKRHQTL